METRESEQFTDNWQAAIFNETEPGSAARLTQVLTVQAPESNWGSYAQLVAYATNPPDRNLYILNKSGEDRLVVISKYPSKNNLTTARILFTQGSPHDPDDSALNRYIIGMFHPDIVMYNLLPVDQSGNTTAYPTLRKYVEYAMNLDRLVACADLDKKISLNPELSIPKRSRDFKRNKDRHPYISYFTFQDILAGAIPNTPDGNDSSSFWQQKIDDFLTQWSNQTGLPLLHDRRLLSLFWQTHFLYGGIVTDNRFHDVIGLTCFTPHPHNPNITVSIVDKNLRRDRNQKPYMQLGAYTHIQEALQIRQTFPRATILLCGGKGSMTGQSDFKESFMSGGSYREHISLEVWSNENRMAACGLPETDTESRDKFIRSIWL